jgi:hypothetical protein
MFIPQQRIKLMIRRTYPMSNWIDNFLKYHMKVLLGDFNAKVGRENISEPTIGNEYLYKICNDNGVRVVNFAT